VWLLVVVTALAMAGGAMAIFGFDDAFGSYRDVLYNSYSMSPTLTAPTTLVVTAGHGPLRRGDLVLVDENYFGQSISTGATSSTVRRVIGIGGDHLVCCDAHDNLQVNGKSVIEDYTTRTPTGEPQQTFDVVVPPGEVFLAGDTRNNAVDSRTNLNTPSHGAVPERDIDALVIGTSTLGSVRDLTPTSAFTKAGLPDEPSSVTGYSRDRTFVPVGLGVFALGIIGVITVSVLRHRRRRVPQVL
jgi:signal peptidase I